MMIDYRIYLVTDDPSRYVGDWLDRVIAAVDGGCTCVQYRDTESPPRTLYERVRRLQDALQPRHTPLVINNDAELAAAVRAEGVHVGQGDLPPSAVRAIVGGRCEIGYSITDIRQLETRRAEIAAADCLGIGPIFDARKTKADAAAAMGVAGLSAVLDSPALAARPSLHTVAIGGITLENASAVLESGVDALAIVSAFSKAENPYAVAADFKMLFDHRRQ